MKVFVTGATGQVGSRLTRILLKRGIEVRAFTRNRVRAAQIEGLGAEIRLGDFDEPATVAIASAGCDAMFLVSSDGPSQVAQEVNATTAAFESGVGHIVKLSSSDAGQRPYIWSRNHHEIELALAEKNIPHSVIRPHYFMQNFLSLLRRTGPRSAELRAPAGDGRIGAIDAHDIARTAATLLEQATPTQTNHVLTGPALVSFGDVATAFARATGLDITYIDQPVSEFISAMSGSPDGEEDVIALFAEIREGGMAILSGEVEPITGSPPRSIDEFAEANVDAIRSAVS